MPPSSPSHWWPFWYWNLWQGRGQLKKWWRFGVALWLKSSKQMMRFCNGPCVWKNVPGICVCIHTFKFMLFLYLYRIYYMYIRICIYLYIYIAVIQIHEWKPFKTWDSKKEPNPARMHKPLLQTSSPSWSLGTGSCWWFMSMFCFPRFTYLHIETWQNR